MLGDLDVLELVERRLVGAAQIAFLVGAGGIVGGRLLLLLLFVHWSLAGEVLLGLRGLHLGPKLGGVQLPVLDQREVFELVQPLQDPIVIKPQLNVKLFVRLDHLLEVFHVLFNHVSHSRLEVEDVVIVNFGWLDLVNQRIPG